jgi:hypothetical protein
MRTDLLNVDVTMIRLAGKRQRQNSWSEELERVEEISFSCHLHLLLSLQLSLVAITPHHLYLYASLPHLPHHLAADRLESSIRIP